VRMSAEDVLQYLEDVMEDEGLHGGQQINTLLEAIAESEDSPHDEDDGD
ncbi:unnamed protein product, partial [marine sediment metagenome]